jgi:hypothetical protein
MTAITRSPSNPNLLHSNKFQLKFSRLPNIQYFCQSVMVPGVSAVEIPRPNPFVELYSPGEKSIYDVLNITFLVDEELLAWKEVHDWIRAITFPTNFEEYASLPNISKPIPKEFFPQFSDATLTLLSAANKELYNFTFVDVFPIAISSFPLSSTTSPNATITADATFRYSYYNITKLF